MSVEWKEPPAATVGRKRSALTIYEDLKKDPGKWALWRSGSYPNSGYGLRKSYDDIEVTLRRSGQNDKGTMLYDVYVRYVGPNREYADENSGHPF